MLNENFRRQQNGGKASPFSDLPFPFWNGLLTIELTPR